MSLGAWGDEGNVGDELNDGYCDDCGEAFHLDDCGGYNPPCNCGKCDSEGRLCRACCRANMDLEGDPDWELEEGKDFPLTGGTPDDA